MSFLSRESLSFAQIIPFGVIFNSLHATGTFMCLHNAPVLRNGHIYVQSDLACNIGCVLKK